MGKYLFFQMITTPTTYSVLLSENLKEIYIGDQQLGDWLTELRWIAEEQPGG